MKPLSFMSRLSLTAAIAMVFFEYLHLVQADDYRPVAIRSDLTGVQPMTGLVLWTTNESVRTAPIQLEYTYLSYAQIVRQKGEYNWEVLEHILDEVASRRHQLILRWHDTYVGQTTGVPEYLTKVPGYKLVRGRSEGKQTEFPDWSHPDLQTFAFEFYSRFAEKYDNDPRLAFVQTGFGLWSEYHIYDGPMRLGETFPSKEFQATFAEHIAAVLKNTPWMISVDAGNDEWSAYPKNQKLLSLKFGLFDDSFNHAAHTRENEPNWNTLGRDRWKHSPAGGEFSFFEDWDQSEALSPTGPHGIPFERQASTYHVSFMIGDDQPRFQKPNRILSAGKACGYHFEVLRFESSEQSSRVLIRNRGIAPFYFDAFPAVNGVLASTSLKGLLPGEERLFEVAAGGRSPLLTIECSRLVPGQKIEFTADLK
ncbi:MAG: hypothetical protein JNL58_19585 [Planctomyces sp.]|nr:hypothetical protein [Planctomyces sp.]